MPKVWNEEKSNGTCSVYRSKETGKKNDNTDVQENLKNQLRVQEPLQKITEVNIYCIDEPSYLYITTF